MEPGDAIIRPPSWTRQLPLEQLFPAADSKPLEVDIGCGKGRFLTARAKTWPDINFLGIDRQLKRLRKADRKIRREQLANVRLLRIEASYAVRYMLPAASVQAFYVFFPDPWPKRRHHRRRLFAGDFLDALDAVLCHSGRVHIATDHAEYFAFIRSRFLADVRFEEIPAFQPRDEERTEFERLFLGMQKTIGRCSFMKRV